MQDFIQSVTQQLGLSAGTGESATTALLGQIGKKAGPEVLGQLAGKVPGLEGFLPKEAEAAPAGGLGGLLGGGGGGGGGLFGGGGGAGGLLGAASKLGGGDLGDAAGLAGALTGSGLSMAQVAPFAKMFLSYIQENGAGGMMETLASQVPALKTFLG